MGYTVHHIIHLGISLKRSWDETRFKPYPAEFFYKKQHICISNPSTPCYEEDISS